MNQRTQQALQGSLAGLAATAPMTAVMIAAHRRLPRAQRDPLPPAQITAAATETAGLDDDLSASHQAGLTLASHFGYGAAMGGLFGALRRADPAASHVPTGMAFGLSVWAASYLGWLPQAGWYRDPRSEPLRRHAMMIAAHLVWGASFGLLMDAMQRTDRPSATKSRRLQARRQETARRDRLS